MTKFEDLTRQIDRNINVLRSMEPGEHGFQNLSIQTSELITQRGEMTIEEAGMEVDDPFKRGDKVRLVKEPSDASRGVIFVGSQYTVERFLPETANCWSGIVLVEAKHPSPSADGDRSFLASWFEKIPSEVTQ